MMVYQKIVEEISLEAKKLHGTGAVARYIPELSRISPEKFGIALVTADEQCFRTGDAQEQFSIQSISKVFTLLLVFRALGEDLWLRVGREPSGNPFNSLVQLEYEHGIPRNPFINAGALVITDMLLSLYPNARDVLLQSVRTLAGNSQITYDTAVAASEKAHGYTNAALANYLKSHNNLHNDVEQVLDTYFYQCSLCLSCEELARSLLLLVHHGIHPRTGERWLTKSQSKRLSAVMLTCGFYDEAGEFAFRVGMPGKSGVGGGIVAFIPNKLSIAVWSPELNKYGNSLAGMKALELFTTRTEQSIF